MADRIRKCITPPINASGIYTAYAPFTLPLNIVYRCDAIRTFKELAKRNIDVYTTYYAPFNLAENIYNEDAQLGASIVTLVSATGEFYYVPNTYIQSYPGSAGVRYDRKIMVVELGLMPSTIDLDYFIPIVQDLVKKNVGVENTPSVVIAPYNGTMSHDQHVTLEASRRVAIQNYVSKDEQIVKLQAQVTALQAANDKLMAVIAAHPELVVK
jgi:hypothetical protein